MNHDCSVVWFPDRHHAELAINGRLFNLASCCVETDLTLKEQEERSLLGGADYYQFHLKLSFEERQRIIERLYSEYIRPHTCSGNVAYVLSCETDMTFPWGVTWLPSTFAEHLYTLHHVPNSRVVSITYTGTDPRPNILTAFNIGRWSEGYFGVIKSIIPLCGAACGLNLGQVIFLYFMVAFLKKFK